MSLCPISGPLASSMNGTPALSFYSSSSGTKSTPIGLIAYSIDIIKTLASPGVSIWLPSGSLEQKVQLVGSNSVKISRYMEVLTGSIC